MKSEKRKIRALLRRGLFCFSGQGIGTTVNRYAIIYKGDAKAINSNDTDPIGGYTQSNTAVTSVTDAIKTPNIYYYLNDATTSNQWTWYKFGDISLWSDYGTNKSIYDPCPYGYRVPINGSWNSWTAIAKYTISIDGGSIGSNIWWPAAGWRYYASGAIEYVGNVGYYWSSTRYTSAAYYSYNLFFSYTGTVYPSNRYYHSNAFPVRCVQERGRALFITPLGHGTWDLGTLFVWVARPKASEGGGEARTKPVKECVGRCRSAGLHGGRLRPAAFASKRLLPYDILSKLKDKHPTGCSTTLGIFRRALLGCREADKARLGTRDLGALVE